MKKLNKIISLIIAAALAMCLVLPAGASVKPVFTVSNASCNPGETFTVTISVNGNPGIVAALLSVTYSKGLELVSVADSGLLKGAVFGSDTGSNPYNLYWEDAVGANNTANGALAVLTFRASDDARGQTLSVGLSYDPENVFNYSLENVTFECVSGTVSVNCEHSFENYVFNNDAACTEDGTKTGTCKYCGAQDTVAAPGTALGHKWDNGTVTVAPTKDHEGTKLYRCVVCGAEKTEAFKYYMGDINSDGNTNGKDDNMLSSYIAGKRNEIDLVKADLNNDDQINGKDGNIMKQIITGIFEAN